MPHIGWLNNSIIGLGIPGFNGVALIYNKVIYIYISSLVSMHFFMVHFANLYMPLPDRYSDGGMMMM